MTGPFKSVQQGPVTGAEPVLIHDLSQDQLVGTILALTQEVYILRERLTALEQVLEAKGGLAPGEVEGFSPGPAGEEARRGDLARFTNRVLSELLPRTAPISNIDPAVQKYL